MCKLVKIRINPSFWLVLCLLFYFRLQFLAVGLVSSVLHEMGHLTTVWLCKGLIRTFQLSMYGGVFDADITKLSKSQKAAVYLSGPVISLAAAGLCFYRCGKSFSVLLFSAGVINFTLCAINLLPVRPLDGGNALCALMGNSVRFKTVETLCRLLFAVVFLFAAICLKSVFVLLFLFYVLFVCRI